MIQIANPIDLAVAEVLRNPSGVRESAEWVGIYDVEHYRGNELLGRQTNHNVITTEGKRYIVDIAMKGQSSTYTLHTAWYVLLSATNTSPVAGMTYVTKQFTEFTTLKTPTTERQLWTGTLDGTLASMTSNAAKASFTIGANPLTQVFGAGLVTRLDLGDSTAGDYLLSYSSFTAITVAENDIIKVGVTVSLS